MGYSGRARIEVGIEALIAGETDPDRLAALAHRRIKAIPEELRQALRGRVTKHHRFLLRLHRQQIDRLNAAVDEIDQEADANVGPFRALIRLLATTPSYLVLPNGAFHQWREDPPRDDTVDVVHGHQQLALFNAHYDERCFQPIHVYDTATSRPVAMLLRPGKTPSGTEIRGHLRRLVRRIRSHWPATRLTIRGDGHYGRPEVMAWCEANGVDYVLGLPGTAVLDRLVEPAADDVRVRRAEEQVAVVRRYTETRYGAKSWKCQRRVAARIEATTKGLDIRYVVTNLDIGTAAWLYDTIYCARGQAENLIKLHKSQLASDRTSCRSPLANQVRLVLHTGAYWLMLKLRDAIPRPQPLASAEFTTLRARLLKIAARITETASRVRIAFAAACPEAELFASLGRCVQLAGP